MKEREPVHGEFAGYDVISAPPPFSGITLIQSLQMAEMLNIQKTEQDTALLHMLFLKLLIERIVIAWLILETQLFLI